MLIFLQEDSKELNKEKFHLSKNGLKKLNAKITTMDALGLQKSDGYKMLKHLQDSEYNQGKKKDEKLVKDQNIHTDLDKFEKPDEGVENKTVEGGIHRNKESKDKTMHAFTDWVYGENGELTLKHKTVQNRLDHTAEKPFIPQKPKMEKPVDLSNKSIKTPNGSEIHVMNETKTIFLKEKHLKKLKQNIY